MTKLFRMILTAMMTLTLTSCAMSDFEQQRAIITVRKVVGGSEGKIVRSLRAVQPVAKAFGCYGFTPPWELDDSTSSSSRVWFNKAKVNYRVKVNETLMKSSDEYCVRWHHNMVAELKSHVEQQCGADGAVFSVYETTGQVVSENDCALWLVDGNIVTGLEQQR